MSLDKKEKREILSLKKWKNKRDLRKRKGVESCVQALGEECCTARFMLISLDVSAIIR